MCPAQFRHSGAEIFFLQQARREKILEQTPTISRRNPLIE